MSLNSTNFVTLGPIKSLDLKQFVDLFTGVMTDQPVTFKNAVMVGGNQGSSTAPLKLFGVASQAGNLIELYPTSGSPNATFGFGALGNFAWGPLTPAANDTFLSRIAMQNGHVTDTAGLLIDPYLEVTGNIKAGGFVFNNSATLTAPAATPFLLEVTQDLAVDRNLTAAVGAFGGATGGVSASAPLKTRAAALGTTVNSSTFPFVAEAYAPGNLLQLSLRFSRLTAGSDWNTATAVIAFDVDGSPSVGGMITMTGNRVALGGFAVGTGAMLQVWGDVTATARISTAQDFVAGTNITLQNPGGGAIFLSGDQVHGLGYTTTGDRYYFMNTGGPTRVQIGNQSPIAQLHISGVGSSAGWPGYSVTGAANTLSTPGGVVLINDAAGAPNNGGTLLIGAGNSYFAGIRGFYQNGASNGIGDLSFATRRLVTDAWFTEAMRITSGGVIDMSMSAGTIVKLANGVAFISGNISLTANTTIVLLQVDVPPGTYYVTGMMLAFSPTANTILELGIRNAGASNAYAAQSGGTHSDGEYHTMTLSGVLFVAASDRLQLIALSASSVSTAIQLSSLGNYGATGLSWARIG